MQVVRIRQDRSIEVLGYCHDFANVRPGDWVRVSEPFPATIDAPAPETVWVGRFKVVPLRDRYGDLPHALEAGDDSTPLEWLPGWQPVAAAP